MPGGDRTGPWAMGAMTGRAEGFCTGKPVPGYASYAQGHGFGRGFRGGGRGKGCGMQYGRASTPGWFPGVAYPAPTQEQEMEMLKSHSAVLENQLAAVKQRLQSIHDGSTQQSK
ncbi:MAG: hypothetical protein GF398_02520 [Chitinivibrionales bacterium]|nr:hypothetical protein [Chitinivibrionales bacterium]